MHKKFKKIFVQSIKPFFNALPILFGIIFLMGLVDSLLTKEFYGNIFIGSPFVDSILASSLGSVFAGNPITSYILAGEFLSQGVGLMAVTAFMLAWVTVGLVQLPAEIMMFGKKFAFWRNFISFIFSILVAMFTVLFVYLF